MFMVEYDQAEASIISYFKHTMNCSSGLIVSSSLLFVVGCLLCVVIVVRCFLWVMCRNATRCFLRDVCCVDVGCLLVFSILLLLLLLLLFSIGVILSDISTELLPIR